jgi:arylsulfatase A-like enzyme
MTYSGHANYNFGNPQASVNRDAVEHLPYSTEVRAYIACQLEFEYAMAYLLDRLEEAGIAERTLIVITSDHYPHGLVHDKNEELAGKSLDRISQLYESAGIIYVKGMEPMIVTTPAYVPDMTPTVLNLLGLPFDSRFLPGRDVFSDAMPFVILGSSIITEDGIYNKHNRRFTPFDGITEIPDEYIPAIVAIEAARNSAVEQIVRLNYFDAIRDFLE